MVLRHPKNLFWAMVLIIVIIIIAMMDFGKEEYVDVIRTCETCKGKGKRFLFFKCKRCAGEGRYFEREKR